MDILKNFPEIDVFYQQYWNKKPFVVRQYIDPLEFNNFIDGDEMAGLSLEDDVKSRIITTVSGGGKWTCDNGPFNENKYATLGEENWSLLVQNVEQYHPDTANLLKYFNFSPRWLMDDIMVSYSTVGGTVGAHTDSYHVFLVQGIGKRTWTIGDNPVEDEACIEGLDLKVLKQDIIGKTVEVNTGDVIYVPPHYAHSGTTLENAMTFSVGFLGPKLSELFVEYGYYLEQMESENIRYGGEELNADSAGFTISNSAQNKIRDNFINALNAKSFTLWLTQYFSTPTHSESVDARETQLSHNEIMRRLKDGENLYRPDNVKLAIADDNLSVFGMGMDAPQPLIAWLSNNSVITLGDAEKLDAMDAITNLYNQNALYFEGDELFD